MRPLGEISLSLLGAMQALHTPERSPTLQELALHTQVGLGAAENTIKNLGRSKRVRIVRTRRVDYRNKPVAEYEPVAGVDGEGDALSQGAGFVDLGSVISGAWR